jgi:hypothetical protein
VSRVRLFSLVAIAALLVVGYGPDASAEPQVRLFDSDADAFAGFAGSGFVGVVLNRRFAPRSYDLFLIDSGDNRIRVNRPGTQGNAGGIDGTTVIYREWSLAGGGKTVLYDTGTRAYTELPLALDPAEPTISGSWVLYDNGSQSGTTHVSLYNIATGEQREIATADGPDESVYAGQVAGDWAAWGRVGIYNNEVYLTNIPTGQTVRIPRHRGVVDNYSPAVTTAGTVYFGRDRPCRRHCPSATSPKGHNQLVEQRRGAPQRIVAKLPRGVDVDNLYAEPRGARTRVLYSRFSWLPHERSTYGDLFAFTAAG